MAVTVEVALDLAANGQGEFFTLDDPVKGVLDNATYLLAGDVFVDMTDRVRSVRLSRGRSSQLSRFTSATGQVVFDNRDRFLDPSWGPRDTVQAMLRRATFFIDAHYADSSQTLRNLGTGGSALDATLGSTGSADSNDPKWLAFTGTPYVYLPGASGNYLSVPDAAALDITGDIDIRVKVAMDDWTPGANSTFLAKYASSPNLSYCVDVNTSGNLRFICSLNGTTAGVVAVSTAATGLTDLSGKWLRWTRNSSTGDVNFYMSDDGSTWVQLGTTVSAATGAMFSGNYDVAIGSRSDGSQPIAGKMYRAIIRNGIDGTTVLDVDCSVLTSGAATSFTEQSSNAATVTINRATSGRKTVCVTQNVWLFGTDDYMSVADSALLNFGASDSFTLIAVVRQWNTSPSYGRYIDKWNGTAGYTLSSNNTSLGALAYVSDTGAHAAQQSTTAQSAGSLAVFSARLDRSLNTIVPGVNTTFATGWPTTSIVDTTNTSSLGIGRRTSGTNYGDFELVAVAVFRRALTATEIGLVSTYFAGRSGTTDPDVPIDGTGSPYYGLIVPRKQVRISDDDGTLVALAQVENWRPDWTMGGDAVMVATLTDGLATLAKATVPETVVGFESSGDRVTAVLDAAEWPAGMRTLDAGRAYLSAGTIDAGTNALTYLQKVEASEPGALFVGKDATVTFLDRATLQGFADPVTFGDDGIPFSEPFTTSYSTDDMANRASVTYTGGTATADDATSQAAYGVLARTVDTFLDDADDAQAFADWTVARSADPILRVDAITVKRGACTDAQWVDVLGLELGSAAVISWTPGGIGDTQTQYVTVDGIGHDAGRGGTEHTVTLSLAQAQPGFILDDPVWGVLDTSRLAF